MPASACGCIIGTASRSGDFGRQEKARSLSNVAKVSLHGLPTRDLLPKSHAYMLHNRAEQPEQTGA